MNMTRWNGSGSGASGHGRETPDDAVDAYEKIKGGVRGRREVGRNKKREKKREKEKKSITEPQMNAVCALRFEVDYRSLRG